MKGIALIGLVGSVLSAGTYLAASALWSAVNFADALWMAPETAPVASKIIWAAMIFASVVGWLIRPRLPMSGVVAMAGALVSVAVAVIAVREVSSRASIDGWPAFGSDTWRYVLAPLYAEHALTACLAFIGATGIFLPVEAAKLQRPRSSEEGATP